MTGDADPLELVGLRVWDGRADRAVPGTLRVEGGRIAAVDAGRTAGDGALELAGCTAIPGLIDAHVHLTLDPHIASPADQLKVTAERVSEQAAERAAAMVRAGITTARDLGGGAWLELELRDRIDRGEVPGPRLLCAGQPVTSQGGHCHFWGGEATGIAEIREVVRRQLERGVDWIKVMATGGMLTQGTEVTRAQFETDELRAVVEASASAGRAVAAHCHGAEGIERAAVARVRTVEHCSFAGRKGFGSDLDRGAVRALAEAGSWVSPTVNVGWRRFLADGKPSNTATRMTDCYAALREAGVPLIASTDAGIPNVEHHLLPRALAVFAELGRLSPVEALRSATSESARALGIDDETGALRPGLSADVLVVEGNPLEDLSALERPRLVLSRGRAV